MDRLEYRLEDFNFTDNDENSFLSITRFNLIFVEGSFEIILDVENPQSIPWNELKQAILDNEPFYFSTPRRFNDGGLLIAIENGVVLLDMYKPGCGYTLFKIPSLRLLPIIDQVLEVVNNI